MNLCKKLIYTLAALNILLLPPMRAEAQTWFPASAVSCSVSSATIDLGKLRRLDNNSISRNFAASCQSKAHPTGYGNDSRLVYAGFCMVIDGSQASRLLTGQESANKGYSIPFNFYFGNKIFENPNYQDYTDPIGNGSDWGISYLTWNYDPGSCPPSNSAAICPTFTNVGGASSPINVKISPAALQQTLPAGIYSGDFSFRYRFGAVQMTNTWPSPASSRSVCSQFPGGTKTGSFHVQLNLEKYCSVSIGKDVDFGKQLFLNKGLTANGSVNVQCTLGTKFGVGIGKGYHSDSGGQRYMTLNNASDTDAKIPYNLYQDAGMTKPWNDFDKGNKDIVTGTGTAANIVYPVYAQVPPQSGLKAAGKYQDTVVITVEVLDPGN